MKNRRRNFAQVRNFLARRAAKFLPVASAGHRLGYFALRAGKAIATKIRLKPKRLMNRNYMC